MTEQSLNRDTTDVVREGVLTLAEAADQLANALSGAMTAAGFDGDPEWKDDADATWWFCRKATWDYAEACDDGWEPDMQDDRAAPPATVAYALKLRDKGAYWAVGWVVGERPALITDDGEAVVSRSEVVE